MKQMEAQYGLRVANVFHAGDGNLHPLILYDANKPGELERAEEFGNDILRLCVEVGGVLTGEHGVGVEKRDLMDTMFTETDMNQQQRLKCAFDPDGLLNPGKVFPQLAAAPSSAACTSMHGRRAFPTCPGSEEASVTGTAPPTARRSPRWSPPAVAGASRWRSSAAAPSGSSAVRCRWKRCSTSRACPASSTTSRPNWC